MVFVALVFGRNESIEAFDMRNNNRHMDTDSNRKDSNTADKSDHFVLVVPPPGRLGFQH